MKTELFIFNLKIVSNMFKTLQEDLTNQFFTEIELTFEDPRYSCSISCHRIILASVPYFYKLFTTFADSLAQKEFVVHVDDAVIAHDFFYLFTS